MNVAVVGSGYVGLVTGVCLAKLGHSVICVDVNAERIAQISSGESPIVEPGLRELLQEQLQNGRFHVTTDLTTAVRSSALTMIAVGTPFGGEEIDLRYVIQASEDIGATLKEMREYHVVVVKSTVVPTTTDTIVAPALARASGKAIGEELGLAMNPEFLQEGSAVANFLDPDRIVIGGWDEQSAARVAELYAPFSCPIVTTSLRNAELIKYASNALLATMISFSNELASLCETLPGLDIEAIMDGLHLDRRLTPMHNGAPVRPGILSYLRAGSGFGGSCLPKDVRALEAFASSKGVSTSMLHAVMDVNGRRPKVLVDRLRALLGNLDGCKIAVLGVAFKPGTDDTRDSPALKLIDELLASGADVHVFDPVAAAPADRRVTSAGSLCEVVRNATAAVLATAWPEFVSADWPALLSQMARPMIVDGRNALRHVQWPAGTQYICVGRL
jgi:UDPglucose 6-dehydrogenase/GDP-mannose 6-dehydrogenase